MIDFGKDFANFINTNNSDAVTSIYNMQPTFSNEQIKIIVTILQMAEKYNSVHLKKFVETTEAYLSKNKNLDFFKTRNMSDCLRAATLEDYFRGMDMKAVNNDGGTTK